MCSDTNDDFPEHAHDDPDDNDYVERNSSPEDFLDPVEDTDGA